MHSTHGSVQLVSYEAPMIGARRRLFPGAVLAGLLAGWLGLWAPARANVTLLYFRATARESDVELRWETATELSTAGFYVRRGTSASGPFSRVSAFVPARGDSLIGATYSATDRPPAPGLYAYQLEEIESNQSSSYYGPTLVQFGPSPNPSATLDPFRSPTSPPNPARTPTPAPPTAAPTSAGAAPTTSSGRPKASATSPPPQPTNQNLAPPTSLPPGFKPSATSLASPGTTSGSTTARLAATAAFPSVPASPPASTPLRAAAADTNGSSLSTSASSSASDATWTPAASKPGAARTPEPPGALRPIAPATTGRPPRPSWPLFVALLIALAVLVAWRRRTWS